MTENNVARGYSFPQVWPCIYSIVCVEQEYVIFIFMLYFIEVRLL